MGDFLLGIHREKKAFGSVFFVSRAVVRGSEILRRVPQQIWCQKNTTFSSCPFWYIYTQSLTLCATLPILRGVSGPRSTVLWAAPAGRRAGGAASAVDTGWPPAGALGGVQPGWRCQKGFNFNGPAKS